MNFSKLLIFLVLLGALAVVAVFMIRREHGDLGRSPYRDLAVLHKLPYEQGLRLRGETRVPGQDQYDQAMGFYERDEFKRASGLLRQALKQQPDSADWWLYYGVSLLMNQEAAEAVPALGKARDLGGATTQDHARWFIAQCRLLLGERDAAEQLLDRLVAERSGYAAEARELLLKLRKRDPQESAGRPTINSPTGQERYLTGADVPISWSYTATAATRYRIMLSTDDGVTFRTTLTQGIEPGTAEWSWSTGGVQGERVRIRVDAVTPDSTILGVPSQPFACVVAPWIELTAPAPGSALRAGLRYDTKWKIIGALPFSYRLELERKSAGDAEDPYTIGHWIDGGETSVNWYNRADVGTGYRLRLIAQFSDTVLTVVSKGEFEIRPAVAMYLGGFDEQVTSGWRPGMPLRLNWETEGDPPLGYMIELCDSLGDPQRVLEPRLDGAAKTWTWTQTDLRGSSLLKLTANYAEGGLVKLISPPAVATPPPAGDEPGAPLSSGPSSAKQPTDISLEQNFPNPFNSSTMIRFTVGQSGPVKLSVYNTLGQLVRTVVDESMRAGTHTIQIEAAGLASGTYIYSLEAAGRKEQKRMQLVK